MPRRNRRRTAVEDAEERPAGAAQPEACWLCARPLGSRTEWHHVRPKSEGGRVTVPVHPICHRTIHASFTNKDLARMARDDIRPADEPTLAGFLKFVARKNPDFHAPTRRRR